MNVKLGLGLYLSVFIAYLVLTALMIFLYLFRNGKLVKNNFVFSLAETYTLLHTVLKFTATETMARAIIGRIFAVVLGLTALFCIYLKIKNNPLANKISAILIGLSLINLWFI